MNKDKAWHPQRTEHAPALDYLIQHKRIGYGQAILCYGCGRGVDVVWLRQRHYAVTGYDTHEPYGFAEPPKHTFPIVLIIYLMTRLASDNNRINALNEATKYLKPGGKLIIISRHLEVFAGDANHFGDQGIIHYLTSLLPEGEYHDPILSDFVGTDNARVVMVRRKGLFRPKRPIVWVDDPHTISNCFVALHLEKRIGLDIETTLSEPRRICTIQIATPDKTWVFDALRIDDWEPIKKFMEDPEVTKIIHNAQFENQSFARLNIHIASVYDTLPVARKRHGTPAHQGGNKLGDVCERELGIFIDKSLQTSDWTRRPLSQDQLHYAAIDAEVLIDLYSHFNPPEPPTTMELF